jgi:hypothetical protein
MNDDMFEPDADDAPPMFPVDEKIVTGSSEFLHHCFKFVDRLDDIGVFDKNKYIYTESKQWGLIFRADYADRDGSDSPLINRMICWKPKSGKFRIFLAGGQDVPPLFPR